MSIYQYPDFILLRDKLSPFLGPISSGGRPGALRKRRGSNEVGKEESRRASPIRCRRPDANRIQGQTTVIVNDRCEYIGDS